MNKDERKTTGVGPPCYGVENILVPVVNVDEIIDGLIKEALYKLQ